MSKQTLNSRELHCDALGTRPHDPACHKECLSKWTTYSRTELLHLREASNITRLRKKPLVSLSCPKDSANETAGWAGWLGPLPLTSIAICVMPNIDAETLASMLILFAWVGACSTLLRSELSASSEDPEHFASCTLASPIASVC